MLNMVALAIMLSMDMVISPFYRDTMDKTACVDWSYSGDGSCCQSFVHCIISARVRKFTLNCVLFDLPEMRGRCLTGTSA